MIRVIRRGAKVGIAVHNIGSWSESSGQCVLSLQNSEIEMSPNLETDGDAEPSGKCDHATALAGTT